MNSSLIQIIGSAVATARQMGLDRAEQHDAAQAVLQAMDPSLSHGVARILVEQLFPAGTGLADSQVAA
jgi:hypothetical protein